MPVRRPTKRETTHGNQKTRRRETGEDRRSREEAEAKWVRRAARINWDNLLVKICWHDDARMESWLREFDTMPFLRKLALVPPESPALRSSVALRNYSTDGTAQYWMAHRHFDVAEWINRGAIRRVTCGRLLNWFLYWRY